MNEDAHHLASLVEPIWTSTRAAGLADGVRPELHVFLFWFRRCASVPVCRLFLTTLTILLLSHTADSETSNKCLVTYPGAQTNRPAVVSIIPIVRCLYIVRRYLWYVSQIGRRRLGVWVCLLSALRTWQWQTHGVKYVIQPSQNIYQRDT